MLLARPRAGTTASPTPDAHSAEAVDAFGAYYLHPLDAALFTTWAVVAFYTRSSA